MLFTGAQFGLVFWEREWSDRLLLLSVDTAEFCVFVCVLDAAGGGGAPELHVCFHLKAERFRRLMSAQSCDLNRSEVISGDQRRRDNDFSTALQLKLLMSLTALCHFLSLHIQTGGDVIGLEHPPSPFRAKKNVFEVLLCGQETECCVSWEAESEITCRSDRIREGGQVRPEMCSDMQRSSRAELIALSETFWSCVC